MIRIALLACLFLFVCAQKSQAEGKVDSNKYVLSIFGPALRDLNDEEFLEDEPIWICVPDLPRSALEYGAPYQVWGLWGRDGKSPHVSAPMDTMSGSTEVSPDYIRSFVYRGFDLNSSFGFTSPTGRVPLIRGIGGIPAGRWEIRPLGDTTRVIARIRVVAPPGSERYVRDGLARAARITEQQPERAASLYDAIYRRYPRTSYLSVLYLGEWRVRQHTRFAHDPERWLEEIFAHFHDSSFGTIALDRWVRDMGEEKARPTIQRLVGLYPDTPLSRAAARYL